MIKAIVKTGSTLATLAIAGALLSPSAARGQGVEHVSLGIGLASTSYDPLWSGVGLGLAYRAPGEQDRLRAETDCLKIFRQRVIETGLLEIAQLDQVDKEVASLIGHAVTAAESAKPPTGDDLLTDVYVSY